MNTLGVLDEKCSSAFRKAQKLKDSKGSAVARAAAAVAAAANALAGQGVPHSLATCCCLEEQGVGSS